MVEEPCTHSAPETGHKKTRQHTGQRALLLLLVASGHHLHSTGHTQAGRSRQHAERLDSHRPTYLDRYHRHTGLLVPLVSPSTRSPAKTSRHANPDQQGERVAPVRVGRRVQQAVVQCHLIATEPANKHRLNV